MYVLHKHNTYIMQSVPTHNFLQLIIRFSPKQWSLTH